MKMDNQDIDLIDRSMANLNAVFAVLENRKPGKVYEVTQIINSFLGVLAHPRDRLLDMDVLNDLPLTDPIVTRLGFREMESSWHGDTFGPRTLGHLIRMLRNGIAHGNVDVLTPQTMRELKPYARIPQDFPESDIAGIEIWNEFNGTRNWGTILTVQELRDTLDAMEALSRIEQFHSRERRLPGGRISMDRGSQRRISEVSGELSLPAENYDLGRLMINGGRASGQTNGRRERP